MKKQGFLHGSIILIMSTVIVKIIGALFKIPLTNFLGGTGMGYFSCAYGIFMIIYAVSVTGLPTAVAKLTAESCALGQYKDVRRIKKVSLLLFSCTGIVSCVLVLALSYPFCKYVAGNESAIPAVIAIAPSVFFGCLMSVYRGYYEGLQNMYPTALSQVTEGLAKLVAGLGLCYITLDMSVNNRESLLYIMKITGYKNTADVLPFAAAVAVFGITISTALGTLFLVLRDKLKGDGITADHLKKSSYSRTRRETISQLMKIIVPVAAGSLITNLTSLIDLTTIMRSLTVAVHNAPDYFIHITGNNVELNLIPTFIFGSFTGLAVSVFNLIPAFTNMFGKGVLPTLSAAFAERNNDAVRTSTINVIFTTAFISMPSGIGISVLSKPILMMLFPEKVNEINVCTSALTVLGVGVIFLTISMSVFSVMQAAGKAQLPVIIMAVGVIVKLVGNTFLVRIPEFNVIGAAISTDLCYFVIMVMSVIMLQKMAKVSQSEIYKMLLKILFCSILCGAGAYIAYSVTQNMFLNMVTLGVSIISGAIFYIISAFLCGILNKNTLKMLIS